MIFRTIQVWATLLSDKPPRVVLNFVLHFFQRICERFYCFPSNKSGTISAQWAKVKGGTRDFILSGHVLNSGHVKSESVRWCFVNGFVNPLPRFLALLHQGQFHQGELMTV
jgi:hypothetical protein